MHGVHHIRRERRGDGNRRRHQQRGGKQRAKGSKPATADMPRDTDAGAVGGSHGWAPRATAPGGPRVSLSHAVGPIVRPPVYGRPPWAWLWGVDEPEIAASVLVARDCGQGLADVRGTLGSWLLPRPPPTRSPRSARPSAPGSRRRSRRPRRRRPRAGRRSAKAATRSSTPRPAAARPSPRSSGRLTGWRTDRATGRQVGSGALRRARSRR